MQRKLGKAIVALIIGWVTIFVYAIVGQFIFFGFSDNLPEIIISSIPQVFCLNPFAYLGPGVFTWIYTRRHPGTRRGIVLGGLVGGLSAALISTVVGLDLMNSNQGDPNIASNNLIEMQRVDYETERLFSSTGKRDSPMALSMITTFELNSISRIFFQDYDLSSLYYNWELENTESTEMLEENCGEECVEKHWTTTAFVTDTTNSVLTISVSRFPEILSNGDQVLTSGEKQVFYMSQVLMQKDYKPVVFDWEEESPFRTWLGIQTSIGKYNDYVLITNYEHYVITFWMLSEQSNLPDDEIEANINYLSFISSYQWKKMLDAGQVDFE